MENFSTIFFKSISFFIVKEASEDLMSFECYYCNLNKTIKKLKPVVSKFDFYIVLYSKYN